MLTVLEFGNSACRGLRAGATQRCARRLSSRAPLHSHARFAVLDSRRMHTYGALALRSPSSWKPVCDGRPCPVSAPFLEPPRRCAQAPRLRPLPDQ
eukprot:6214178-Pleurochrysis_carterae.AAC.1